MSETIYRLLNVGEVVHVGDEFAVDHHNYNWRLSDNRNEGFKICIGSAHYRRPLETGWVPITEREPEYPCLMAYQCFGAEWCVFWARGLDQFTSRPFTHWQKFVAPEPVKSADEKAFEEYAERVNGKGGHNLGHDIWFAALAWERGRTK